MGERKDNPPTLATLRSRRAKPKPPRDTASSRDQSQTSLFLTEVAEPSAAAAPRPALNKAEPCETALRPAESALPAERRIWTVRALVSNMRQLVETTYTDLWVEGEISNCRPAPSGHLYFTLRDGEAQLYVVMFRRQSTLLRFRPADGLAVLVRGRISVYEGRGQLQLIAETLEPRGAGALQLAFEQLKARLLAEGLFDAERKRPLPAFPRCIGVITSPTGAVIRDIVTVGRRRHARLNLLIYPATMQGETSSASVAAGVRWFNAHPTLVDVIIIARGGGSMEDLASFNDEALARTIAASGIPIVSAIGHETDFTIADFVADLRAPTPSAAAELVTAAQHRIGEHLDALAARILRAGRYHLIAARQRYTRLSAESVLARLRDSVDRRQQQIDELRLRLESASRRLLLSPSERLAALTERLRRQNISLRIATTHRRLESADSRLSRLITQTLSSHRTRIDRAAARLEALSPLAVLSRGYALIYAGDGALLRSAADTAAGQPIHARLGSGSLEAQVTATHPTEKSNR